MSNQKHLLATAIAVALTTPLAFAEEQGLIEEEKIIVTASRYQRSVDEVLASVAVIDRSDIEKIQPLSVADLLQTVAGIDIARQGGQAQQTSSFTRGTNSSHTLILVDGVRVGSATTGSTSLANIPTEQIERVEVVKGPRASLYGSDAIGGVIQIFTRQLGGGEYSASAEVGSDSFKKLSAAAGFIHGHGSTTVSVSGEESDGFDVYKGVEDDDDGYDRINVAVNGSQQLDDNWRLGWVGRFDDGNSEFDDTFGGEYINEQDFRNHILQAKLSYLGESWQHEVMAAISRDSSVSFGTNLDKADADKFETRRKQLTGVSHYNQSDMFNWTFGGEFYRDEIYTTGEYAEDERDVYGIYAGGLFTHNGVTAEASVRYDDVDKIDSETTYNVSAGYQFGDLLFAGFNIGTGFKAPSFNDLYYPSSPWSGGNPDLVSETSDSYELLLRSKAFDLRWEASLYKTDIDNLIDWAPDENYFFQPVNIASAEIDGMELSVGKSVDNFTADFFYSYVDAKDVESGERLDRRARHKANVALSYAMNNWLFATNYGYHGSRFDRGNKLENYQVLDISVNYQISVNWEVQLKANNIFDEDYENVTNYNPPGSQYFLKLTYSNF